MAHSLNWGVLSTISSRLTVDADGNIMHDVSSSPTAVAVPFGNIISIVDGPCHNSTGIPYMYSTYFDQTMIDVVDNPLVSLSLSEASLTSACSKHEAFSACTVGTKYGDPESPICARLTLTGKLVVLEENSKEYNFAQHCLISTSYFHAIMA